MKPSARFLPQGSPTSADVGSAAERIAPHIRRTPLELSTSLSSSAGSPVYLKLESLQTTGSFKARGALNALSLISDSRAGSAVVTASAGNHGLGVAFAARAMGMKATIFLPRDAAMVKRERIRALGAEIRAVEGGYDEAHHAAEQHAGSAGLPYIHAFSDSGVVAGQGTVGLEIVQDLPEVASILVPVGGGGLVGGIGIALRNRSPATRLIGVQSEATSAMHDSWKAGSFRSPPVVPTLCEGLSGDVDEVSLRLAMTVMDDIVLIRESMVAEAIRRLFLEDGIVAEGSAAVCAAAIWNGLVPLRSGPTAVVITGCNLDPLRLANLLSEGQHPSETTTDRIS